MADTVVVDAMLAEAVKLQTKGPVADCCIFMSLRLRRSKWKR